MADPGGPNRPRPPPPFFSSDFSFFRPIFFFFFFFFFLLVTPEVGLVGGRYPIPNNVIDATTKKSDFPGLPFHKSWIRHWNWNYDHCNLPQLSTYSATTVSAVSFSFLETLTLGFLFLSASSSSSRGTTYNNCCMKMVILSEKKNKTYFLLLWQSSKTCKRPKMHLIF